MQFVKFIHAKYFRLNIVMTVNKRDFNLTVVKDLTCALRLGLVGLGKLVDIAPTLTDAHS